MNSAQRRASLRPCNRCAQGVTVSLAPFETVAHRQGGCNRYALSLGSSGGHEGLESFLDTCEQFRTRLVKSPSKLVTLESKFERRLHSRLHLPPHLRSTIFGTECQLIFGCMRLLIPLSRQKVSHGVSHDDLTTTRSPPPQTSQE